MIKSVVDITILYELLKDSWKQNIAIKKSPIFNQVLITDSIPVLWFGDLEGYSNSERRVVSVGINPSANEFTPNYRFPLKISPNIPAFDDYAKAMGMYYNYSPYIRWFSPLNAALNACGATYGGESKLQPGAKIKYTGIHIDAVAPIATISWSKLNSAQQGDLKKRFSCFFEKLVKALDPDVLIIPIKISKHLPQLALSTINTVNVRNTHGSVKTISKTTGTIGGKQRTVIVGWNGPTPFPYHSQKNVFAAIKKLCK